MEGSRKESESSIWSLNKAVRGSGHLQGPSQTAESPVMIYAQQAVCLRGYTCWTSVPSC